MILVSPVWPVSPKDIPQAKCLWWRWKTSLCWRRESRSWRTPKENRRETMVLLDFLEDSHSELNIIGGVCVQKSVDPFVVMFKVLVRRKVRHGRIIPPNHTRETYPESYPRIIPPNHTAESHPTPDFYHYYYYHYHYHYHYYYYTTTTSTSTTTTATTTATTPTATTTATATATPPPSYYYY